MGTKREHSHNRQPLADPRGGFLYSCTIVSLFVLGVPGHTWHYVGIQMSEVILGGDGGARTWNFISARILSRGRGTLNTPGNLAVSQAMLACRGKQERADSVTPIEILLREHPSLHTH